MIANLRAVPSIPPDLLDLNPGVFLPSEDWEAWAREMFIEGDGPTVNPDHAHLSQAMLGFVLTNEANHDKGRQILGTCQVGQPSGKPWSKGQRAQQIKEWFGIIPDFLITLDAVFLSTATTVEACALVEHELYHAGQKLDVFGSPMFDRETGRPVFTIKPHDVEEFAGITARYGAWEPGLQAMKASLMAEPIFGEVRLNGICGCGAGL